MRGAYPAFISYPRLVRAEEVSGSGQGVLRPALRAPISYPRLVQRCPAVAASVVWRGKAMVAAECKKPIAQQQGVAYIYMYAE